MTSVAYLSNCFPEPLEPYVSEEILELRKRGCRVLACSVRKPESRADDDFHDETLYAFPLRLKHALIASGTCISKFALIADLVSRGGKGPEPLSQRLRTLAHTWLGAYLASVL